MNDFLDDWDKSNNLNPKKENTKEKKINVYRKAWELYNDFLGIYYHKNYELSGDKRKKNRVQI